MIKFSAHLEPVPFKRVMTHGKRRFNLPRYVSFKETLGLIAKFAMNGRAPLEGAIKLTADVYKKIIPTALTFGDWDNHAKAICDALNGICYIDDRQIVDGRIRLFKGEPRIVITLEETS